MAIIQSGASADLLTVDPTSKAARVTLYNAAGEELLPKPTGAFMLPVAVDPSAGGAGNTIWAMRVASGLVVVRRIILLISFHGTAAASTSQIDVVRFSTATPTGGTVLTPVKKRTAWGASGVTDARFAAAGLSVTSVVFETAMASIGVARQVNATNILPIDFVEATDRYYGLELAAGEGLCLRTTVASVAGDALRGTVEWDER